MGVLVSVIRCAGPDDEVVYVQDAEERLRSLGWIKRCEARTLAVHDLLRTPGFGFQMQLQPQGD